MTIRNDSDFHTLIISKRSGHINSKNSLSFLMVIIYFMIIVNINNIFAINSTNLFLFSNALIILHLYFIHWKFKNFVSFN